MAAELERLVDAHYSAVIAVAYATTRDLALAEDVAQETFLVAWRTQERLRDPARVRPWLCGIARNQARNALRGRKREVAGEHETADATPSVADAAVEREQVSALHAALAEVPETYREPLVLFYWEDKSIAQVASALSISEEAAQKRISRARGYLKDELAAPLESAGRARRGAAAAAAAVLALIATRSAAAQAAPAAKGFQMTLVKGLGAAALAGLVAGAIAIGRGGASDAAPETAPATPVARTTPSAAPRAPAATTPRPQDPALPKLPGAADPGPPDLVGIHGRLPTPAGYELTVLSPRSVAVNLAGGGSDVYVRDPKPAPAFVRHVRGKVVDGAGAPVAGAVVLVGQIHATFGSLFGDAGAVSGPDGAFDIATHDDAATFALALHPHGWSPVVAVPAGQGDATIALVAPAPGTLALHVRQGAEGREATIIISPAGGGFELSLGTDARGDLAVPLLAPGAYTVKAYGAQMYGGGTSKPIERETTVAAARTTEVPLPLASGALVVALAKHEGLATAEYFLLDGTQQPELADLVKRRRSSGVLDYLLGGVDVGEAAQFHDVAPGPHTLCIDAALDRDHHLPFVCKPFEVAPGKDAIELNVAL